MFIAESVNVVTMTDLVPCLRIQVSFVQTHSVLHNSNELIVSICQQQLAHWTYCHLRQTPIQNADVKR